MDTMVAVPPPTSTNASNQDLLVVLDGYARACDYVAIIVQSQVNCSSSRVIGNLNPKCNGFVSELFYSGPQGRNRNAFTGGQPLFA
jgi:hypothetical protein